jgi:CDP-diacylglycerol--glycerol-3-phosphate 3-phosphatidyltransferase
LFVVGAASDFLDGYLARRHEMTTATGAWLDPLSDKLLVAVPAVVLAAQGLFPGWAAALIVGREVLVALLRWRLDKQGVSMPASKVAKAKTVSQLVAVGMAIAPLAAAWDRAEFLAVLAAVGLTTYSGAEYLLTSRHRVRA